MIYLGIDPGKEGAIAFIDTGAAETGEVPVWYEPMPLVKSAKGRDEYDLRGILDRLEIALEGQQAFATVEKLQPMPLAKGGTIANFNRGMAHGWAWMLAALELPYQLVSPQAWQKVMHAGTPGEDTKQRSVIAAQRLFPAVSLTPGRRVKPHDGIAEALLLADFGRRTHGGAA